MSPTFYLKRLKLLLPYSEKMIESKGLVPQDLKMDKKFQCTKILQFETDTSRWSIKKYRMTGLAHKNSCYVAFCMDFSNFTNSRIVVQRNRVLVISLYGTSPILTLF